MSVKVTWLGEEDGPDTIELHGVTFPAGKAVDVSEDMSIRLMGNPYFKRDDGKAPLAEKVAADNQAAVVQANSATAQVAVAQANPAPVAKK